MITEVTSIKLPENESLASNSLIASYEPLPYFVAGPENRLAVPVLEQLLDADRLPAVDHLNPLVFTGTSGSGKSFLARSLVRHWTQSCGTEVVGYFSAIDFARELRDARNSDTLDEFEQSLAEFHYLVVEDLVRLPTSTFVQSKLRDTIDLLQEQGSLIVFTSQRPPETLPNLEAGLRDRLSAGLTVNLSTPGNEARAELLKLASESRNLGLAEDRIQFLSQNTSGSATQVLQALVNDNLSEDVAATRKEPLELKSIVAVVARYFSLTQASIRSNSRRKSLVYARSVTVYLARSLTKLSYAEIGRGLGGRDHTTIMHAQHNIEKLLKSDVDTQRTIEDLHRILSAH